MVLLNVVEMLEDLSMTSVEANVKAARTGQMEDFKRLLGRSDCYPLQKLLDRMDTSKALPVALLFEDCGDRDRVRHVVLNIAAARGFVDVVELLSRNVSEPGFGVRALSNAISGGHVEVVKVQLTPDGIHWHITKAVDQAAAEGQHAIVQLIHERFRGLANAYVWTRDDLFAHTARYGRPASVKYLFEHGFWVSNLTGDAVVAAADTDRIDVLEFLHSTGKISSQSLDEAFVAAARNACLKSVKWLFAKQLASAQAVNGAVLAATSVAVVKFLLDTVLISVDSIGNILRADPQQNHHSRRSKYLDLAKCLVDEGRVPAEVLAQEAERAANCGGAALVEIFREDRNDGLQLQNRSTVGHLF